MYRGRGICRVMETRSYYLLLHHLNGPLCAFSRKHDKISEKYRHHDTYVIWQRFFQVSLLCKITRIFAEESGGQEIQPLPCLIDFRNP